MKPIVIRKLPGQTAHQAIVAYFQRKYARINRSIPVRTTQFVEVTSLVPKSWVDWFWGCISENAPFSWGDNNRSMITADDLADHCDNRIMELSTAESTTYGARREWIKKIRRLGQLYVDLEN